MNWTNQQRALITGASSGIGAATALAFAKAGIHVALVSRSQEKLAQVAETVKQAGVETAVYPVDLSQVEQVREQIEKIATEFGPIDILVNNAGMGYTCPLADIPLQDWQHVFNLNLTSAFQCIQAVLPQMRNAGKGTIINIVSIAGHNAFPGWSAYCASKFAMLGMSRALAAEERANGIRVTAMCPGAVNTPLWDASTVHADFNRDNMLDPETVADTIVQAVQLPQDAVVEEMTLMSNAGVL
jgi:short-subunit dehydrogenase